jgi:CO/xanthine dehydrogenase Mo-binding subunit
VELEELPRRLALGPPVALDHVYDSATDCAVDGNALNFSALVVDVEVDPGTGQVTVHGATTVTDVGAVLNPIAHEGQIDGGFIFGLGATLTEDMLLEDGRVMNPSLADYKIPTTGDAPPFRIILLPGNDGPGPFGAKAVGELSNVGVGAAIANAIHDTVGIRIMKLPIGAETILAALS